jgi:prepilin-type N-terminal cleavage/methylation domain-containing protein
MAMNGASGKYCRRALRASRAAAGFSLVEILVSTAVMAVMAAALGSLLSATTYQSARALVDQRVNMLVNREVNFFRSVPYSSLTSTGLASEAGTGQMIWQQEASSDTQTQVYVSMEGDDGNSYLSTTQDPSGTTDSSKCRYHYLITRTLTMYYNGDPNTTPPSKKTVALKLEWWGPNPKYNIFMTQTQRPVGNSADWQDQENNSGAVYQNITVNTIYRYP